MTITELYDSYRAAYLCGSNYERLEFLQCLKSYDISKYDCDFSILQHSLECESLVLTSGGSTTGNRVDYVFGPQQAVDDVERLQKSCGGTPIWLSGTFRDRPPVIKTKKLTFQFRYDLSNLQDLFRFIEISSSETNGRITLCGLPHNWLFLLSINEFFDYVQNSDLVAGIVSTDWSPMIKKRLIDHRGIYFNDCMIDWQTGLNFYTCRFGHQHVWPLFINNINGWRNWLNLSNTTYYQTKDILVNGNSQICQCGHSTGAFSVLPRTHTIVNHELIESIRSIYYNLQFVIDKFDLLICYSVAGEFFDRELFEFFFKDYNIIYHVGKLCICGSKWPHFWDSSLGPFKITNFTP